jgi:hypothetical protein
MGRRARALDWRLRSTRHLHQHLERFDNGLLADIAASDRAKATFTMIDASVASSHGKMHEADRLARRRATWPGDAGN